MKHQEEHNLSLKTQEAEDEGLARGKYLNDTQSLKHRHRWKVVSAQLRYQLEKNSKKLVESGVLHICSVNGRIVSERIHVRPCSLSLLRKYGYDPDQVDVHRLAESKRKLEQGKAPKDGLLIDLKQTEKKDDTYCVDMQQVHMVSYDEGIGQWCGLVYKRVMTVEEPDDVRKVLLTQEWMETNFSPKDRDKFKRGSSDRKYVEVPTGSCREENRDDYVEPPNMLGQERESIIYPRLKYLQGDRKLCLYYSVASALHYLGATSLATKVAKLGDRIVDGNDERYANPRIKCMTPMRQYVMSHCSEQWEDLTLGKDHDLLNSPISSDEIKVIRLCSHDGDIAHCVTIVGHWLFDSNREHAMILCRESLDWCCGDKKYAKYRRVEQGVYFRNRVRYPQSRKKRKGYRCKPGKNNPRKRTMEMMSG
jgi:hypothetical protein